MRLETTEYVSIEKPSFKLYYYLLLLVLQVYWNIFFDFFMRLNCFKFFHPRHKRRPRDSFTSNLNLNNKNILISKILKF